MTSQGECSARLPFYELEGMMDFREAEIAIRIFEKYTCGQKRDWGDEENRKLPIGGTFEFGHDQCWITLPRTSDEPNLTHEEREELDGAGWFFDEEVGSWSHF